MRIRIKTTKKGRGFCIVFPNFLIFNRLSAAIAAKALKYAHDDDDAEEKDSSSVTREFMSGLSAKQFRELFAVIRRMRKKHGKLTLVDIVSANGEKVEIII